MSRRVRCLAAMVLLLATGVLSAQQAPWGTWTLGRYGWWVGSPTAYLPAADIATPGLSEPSDVATDAAGRLLIADTGNARVLLGTPGTEGDSWAWTVLGEGQLNSPTGVAFGADGKLWVADAGDDTVSAWSVQGEKLVTLGRPESLLFGATREFKPRKLVVDRQGTVTIVSEGSSNGLVVLSGSGEFLGYFGVNPVKIDLQTLLQKVLFSKEQQARLLSTVPPSPDNLALDREGLILTVTKNDRAGLRRLNVAGSNLLTAVARTSAKLQDASVDAGGRLLTVAADGLVSVHDRQGQPLFLFNLHADAQLVGGVNSASAIAGLPDGSLVVTDNARGLLVRVTATDFAQLVYDAVALHEQGKYLDSRALWEQVLARDSLFSMAHLGIARGEFLQKDYAASLASFERGNGRQGWSDSFRELRDRWFAQWLAPVFGGVLVLVGGLSWWSARARRGRPPKVPVYRRVMPWQLAGAGATWQEKLALRVRFVGWFVVHPVDGATAIQRHAAFGATAALLVLLVVTLVRLASFWLSSWLFARSDLGWLDLSFELLVLVVPLLVLALANWLVATLDFGRGTWPQVVAVVTLSLVPLALSWPVLAVVSRALSLQEAFVLDFGAAAAWAWSVGIGLTGLAELHGFGPRKMLKNLLLTVFAALILALVGGFLYILWDQLAGFVVSLFSEAQAHAIR